LAKADAYNFGMWYFVYILESESGQHYVGLTKELKERLKKHNCGVVKSTVKYTPWNIIHFAGFQKRKKAAEYEIYLKSGSGRAFQKRHLR